MRIFIPILFLFLFSVSPPRVLALSSSAGLSVEPVFQEVSFPAEERQVNFSITLTNTTDQSLVLRPSVVDFGSLDESGGVAFLGASDNLERKYALASWMRPEKDIVSLAPGETESIEVNIENRESLSPGGHYGAVLFQVGSDEGEVAATNIVAVRQLVSVLVFAKKEGGERYNLELKENKGSQSVFSTPSTVELRFQNGGNTHVTPRGIVTLTDSLGRIVGRGVLNEESGVLLPETQRVYKVALKSLKKAFIPGTYQLKISYRYDGREEFVTTTDTFLVLPWRVLLGGMMVVMVIFFKRWKKKGYL